ncbi:Hcp family type VI secretion system effector [Azohydromonas caseinilytica]|uniref:Type VI secretion system tube protein Hcp n=1 Tax=Azohydromonas caseinilytica TaxID=2728836 RepID=A0A848FLA3_9BURK|nr:type VI secretion system tube protein Hcp [Azohydromonas caseinilytica]NML19040.1 type VI secretion system tube protein Hcp [Azohydromonas caseinilytica]
MKDIYLKFVGATELQGDSTDTAHLNEIEITSFSHLITQPKSSTASTAGAHTAERTEIGELVFTKDIDRASAKLNRACAAGTVYPKVYITFYRAYGGKNATSTAQTRIDYYKIVLDDVIVSSVATEIGEGELPMQRFGLKCSKITWEYKQHKLDGSSASTGIAGWDLARNIAV